MKLTDSRRIGLFNQARALSPTLGDLFQNSADISDKDLQSEIDIAWDFLRNEKVRIQKYIGELGMLLCFPELEPKGGDHEADNHPT